MDNNKYKIVSNFDGNIEIELDSKEIVSALYEAIGRLGYRFTHITNSKTYLKDKRRKINYG
ncbi:unnamed protein product [marine sediment metagenome]|uniref:Uncharacterized protein n=1 Tax=marine sediment metagenome TaxID=412755 RepID=X0TLF3_9ZZZZ